jgi:hypothetical protein
MEYTYTYTSGNGTGDLYWVTASGRYKYFDGSGWVDLGWYQTGNTSTFAPPAIAASKEVNCTCIEDHDLITASEFQKFVTKLVRDKKGALPDVADWKKLKQQMDRIYDPEKCKCGTSRLPEGVEEVDTDTLTVQKILDLADKMRENGLLY